jgi:nucleotide-binding universal stress UspA family protein
MKALKKKILIAIDYNSTAQKVAEEGFALARLIKADIVLIHVISDPVNYTSDEHITIMGFVGFQDIIPFQNDNKEAVLKQSWEFLKKTRQHLGDESIQIVVKEGDIAESVLKTATDLDADIIVMGSHSRKCLEKAILGSVTEKVLSKTTLPLFIVPPKKTIII